MRPALRPTLLALLMAGVLFAQACDLDEGGDLEGGDVGTSSEQIVGGETTVRWDAVGYMNDGEHRCSGTLIAPNAFLTAAHCTLWGRPIRVGFGDYNPNGQIPVARIYRSPAYQAGAEPDHDVAVLILASAVGIQPIPIAGSEYPGVTPPGRELRVIGYGDEVSGATEPVHDGAKPRKTAHVHVNWAHTYSMGTTGINGAACFGDSGGPIMDLNGTKVYGVMSLLFVPCTSTDRNRFAAVAYEPFIGQAINDNPPAPRSASTPLWRYFNGTGTDHFYTVDRNDAGYAYFGYGIETAEGRLFRAAYPGTVPLYRYFRGSGTDHFYTTSWAELGAGAYGWGFERVEGYLFPRPYAGAVPLYRYWNPYGTDHFYTINRNDAGYAYFGYGFEGVVGYVYP